MEMHRRPSLIFLAESGQLIQAISKMTYPRTDSSRQNFTQSFLFNTIDSTVVFKLRLVKESSSSKCEVYY